jgi:heme/copper-type cytochrome/quinol oxidase subunit 2
VKETFPLFPQAASTLAGRVDALYIYLIAVSVVFTVMIALAIIYFAIKYRDQPAAQRRPRGLRRRQAVDVEVPARRRPA